MNTKSEIIRIVKSAFSGYGIGEHCRKYGAKDHGGYETIMKYEAQNIAEDIISAIESLPMEEGWTLASDCLPAYGQYVLFTMIESNDEDEEIFVYPCFWDEQAAFELADATLIAWMPTPKPYRKEKMTEQIRKKAEKLAKEKGERYALGSLVAAMLVAIIYGSKTDEEAKLATKELKDIPKENIKDGIGIVDIFLSEDEMTIFEAADIYFKEA